MNAVLDYKLIQVEQLISGYYNEAHRCNPAREALLLSMGGTN